MSGPCTAAFQVRMVLPGPRFDILNLIARHIDPEQEGAALHRRLELLQAATADAAARHA